MDAATQCRRVGYDTLPASALRVLAALMDLRSRGETPTIQRLIRRIGWASVNATYHPLTRLRAAGLVDWEPGKGATLTARCVFAPAEKR